MKRKAMVVGRSAKKNPEYTLIRPDWYAGYIGTETGKVYDRFTERIRSSCSKTVYLLWKTGRSENTLLKMWSLLVDSTILITT